jgi:hypothetical protein
MDHEGLIHWVGARKSEQKRGADEGIDGRLSFHDNPKEGTKQMILSVKSGERIGVRDVRDLRGYRTYGDGGVTFRPSIACGGTILVSD